MGWAPALTADCVRRLLPGCTLLGAASALLLVSAINTDETNPWMAETVLRAALGVPTTLRSRTSPGVVDVRRVCPEEKFGGEEEGFGT